MNSRPRLLYFNGPWDYLGERLVTSYIEPFRRLLEQDFEVISLEGNRNFADEVKQHRPDVVLFHTGTESPLEREVSITHTDAFPELPRMGYVFRDPVSPSRLGPMNRLRAWGANQVFTDFRASDCPTPLFANSIYLPWWIDDRVFRDYGEEKTLPITLTGTGWVSKQFYTWRQPIFLQLLPRLPVYHVPAFETHQKQDAYIGESYARLLNRSSLSAGCGSASRYLTLKLLEIPAARCCLLTEETEVLKAIGFRHGVNCVFADASNVVSRVQELLDNPGRLQAITDAGFQLVHSQHTQRNRRVFAEWFRLWQSKAAGETIVQVGPFEPLRILAEGECRPPVTFPEENPMTAALKTAYTLVEQKRWAEAMPHFEWVLNVVPYVAEARLGAAICELHQHKFSSALAHLEYIAYIQFKLSAYKRPDPVSLALQLLVLVRSGDLKKVGDLLVATSGMRHPALNAFRWMLARRYTALRHKLPVSLSGEGDEAQNSESLHWLPPRKFSGWVQLWTEYLVA
jgi:hypothetical protein